MERRWGAEGGYSKSAIAAVKAAVKLTGPI